jgi:D-glycero-D-manno-heptose 1,7-bisphosphate phosphatase
MPERAVFLDRDGTICTPVEFLEETDVFTLIEGAGKAIRSLNKNGFKVVVVTNQPALVRGSYDKEILDAVHEKMHRDLADDGAKVDAVYICPHHPGDNCSCMKPKPGLILQASEEMGIDLAGSYLIGDSISDIVAGKAAECVSILVLTGYGEGELSRRESWETVPDHIADNIFGAVEWILKRK